MTQLEPSPKPETKDRILDSAEALFAESGFDATSLRGITTHADVNLAAVHYHFGSKEALLQAVLERRLEPINQRRLELLDALEEAAGNGPLDVEAVLRAFLEPPLRQIRSLGEAGAQFVRLAGRAHSEPNPKVRLLFLRLFQTVVARYAAAFRRALPGVNGDMLHWKFHFLIGAMAHILSWGEHNDCARLVARDPIDEDPEIVLETLVAFCAAGMSAQCQPDTSQGGGPRG